MMSGSSRRFSPDDANRLDLWQGIAIGLISIISVAMIIFGALPIFPVYTRDLSFAQAVLCALLLLSGVFILYSVLFNVFRIVERNQRRRYEWESSKTSQEARASRGENAGEG